MSKAKNTKDGNFLKFLGTAGARFVMIKQLRYSAGIWLHFKDTDLIIDPGPGALLRCSQARPKLDPSGLDAIILTHKHLDHSGDVNVMIEALTGGGFKKEGVLFSPKDAFGPEGVIFSYLEDSIGETVFLKTGVFKIKDVKFEAPLKNKHSVETYGLKFLLNGLVVSLVSDTAYFPRITEAYKDSDILILNVVSYQKREGMEHLCLDEALQIIQSIRPPKTILTHFGMTMLKQKPHELEKKLQKELDLDIQCAYDGMSLPLGAL
ncbi:MAG: MBL fold metallo-hydrolase [Candidatus Omnitrophica bacterium]|nr:MBL fold metallo-hydrolase [Candidatus Omnitrophota bacterium]